MMSEDVFTRWHPRQPRSRTQ